MAMSMSTGTGDKSFDPSRYLTRIPKRVRDASGSWTATESEYLEVKWRVLWLRTEHPNAVLETELISHQDGLAIFRARVALPEGGSATGWGHETAGDFEDYLEKAETKALGRALAALGYGTQFCEDFDFEEARTRQGERRRVVDGPVPRVAGEVSPGESFDNSNSRSDAGRRPPPATEAQIKAIYGIGRGALALNEEEVEERCRARFGVIPAEMTRRQASEFIDALKMGAATSVN